MAQKPVLMALAAAAFVLVAGGESVAQDKEKALSARDIMKAGHLGPDALLEKTDRAVKGGNWSSARQTAKALDDNAALLGKATPRKGRGGGAGADSWTSQTKKYHGNTTALWEATEKEDASAAKAAILALRTSCKECHGLHKRV